MLRAHTCWTSWYPRLLRGEALKQLVSWQCFSLILLPPIPPILPSLSCLPLQIWDRVLQQTHWCPQSGDMGSVGRDEVAQVSRLQAHPKWRGFLLIFHLPATFSTFPSQPHWHFPSGICGCVMGMDKHLLLRCHKPSFPKILVPT